MLPPEPKVPALDRCVICSTAAPVLTAARLAAATSALVAGLRRGYIVAPMVSAQVPGKPGSLAGCHSQRLQSEPLQPLSTGSPQ